jgi:hypothetical protein
MRFWLNQIDGSCTAAVVASFAELIEKYNLGETRLVYQGVHLNE